MRERQYRKRQIAKNFSKMRCKSLYPKSISKQKK